MSRVVIWGAGRYFEYKVAYWDKEEFEIVGIIDKSVKGNQVNGYTIIKKEDIHKISYDKLIIMSERYMFEILNELRSMGVDTKKIELGVNLPPATVSEMSYISENMKLFIKDDGTILWNEQIEVASIEDIEKVKMMNRGYMSKEAIKVLPIKPLSYDYGASRGGYSIARYYIDSYAKANLMHIKGNVMEVGDSRYTDLSDEVEKSQILVLGEPYCEKCVKGNLETGEGIVAEMLDCFILTNVFSSLFDVNAAVANVGRSLKKGGKAIITVPGIAAISKAQYETYGQFWRFTPSSLRKLLETYIPNAKITIRTYGNVKSSVAFLYGMTIDDLTGEELDCVDSNYPMVIGALLEK